MLAFHPPTGEIQVMEGSVGSDPKIAYTLVEPTGTLNSLTLVLLNGAAHLQTCWRQFALYLAQRGVACVTLDYRGMGESCSDQPVQLSTLDQKVEDVKAVLEALGIDSTNVVLLGHSLGGAVAQRFAEQQSVAGLILMGTLALGQWKREVLAQMPFQLLKHPMIYPSLRTDPSKLFASMSRAREYLFDQQTPREAVRWYLEHVWTHDSGRAMSDMLAAKSRPLRTKRVLFLAGRQDASVSRRAVRASAARLHAPCIEIDVPHDGMFAGDWQGAADVVRAFIQQVSFSMKEQQGEVSYAAL